VKVPFFLALGFDTKPINKTNNAFYFLIFW